jgi:hypothetical protein
MLIPEQHGTGFLKWV